MIKLVVTDIDGTIVPEGTDQINPELFDIIRELRRKGILFAAASGRQYESMRHVFEPVADEIYFIAENGTNIMYRGENLNFAAIENQAAQEVIDYVRQQEMCKITVSTMGTMYVEGHDASFWNLLVNGYRYQVNEIDDVIRIQERINKITLFHPVSVAGLIDDAQRRFGERLYVTYAGNNWIDFMAKGVDKGAAVADLQRRLRVSREETMAFGDNCNDIGMLRQAGEGYAVANSHPKLLEAADYKAPAMEENGVLRMLRERLL